MAIDRIGKGAGLPPTPETSGTGPSSPFKVDRPEASAPTSSAERAGNAEATRSPSEATPLERLRAGEVDVNGYIDLEVDKATSALQGLPSSELDTIKSVLRDQMRSDPGLVELVRAATGTMPTPPEE